LLIIANYAFNLASFSQGSMVFDKYGINDGLNENNIKVIVQDTTGFIRIGTNGNEINKFDGYSYNSYTNLKNDPYSLISNSVLSIHINQKGMLWVGTSSGNHGITIRKV